MVFGGLNDIIRVVCGVLNDDDEYLSADVEGAIRRHVIALVPCANCGECEGLDAVDHRLVYVRPQGIKHNTSTASGGRSVPVVAANVSDVRYNGSELFCPFPLRGDEGRAQVGSGAVKVLFRLVAGVAVANDHDQKGGNCTLHRREGLRFLVRDRRAFFFRLLRSFTATAHRVPRYVDEVCVLRDGQMAVRFVGLRDRFRRRFGAYGGDLPNFLFGVELRRAMSVTPGDPPYLDCRVVPP